MILIDHNISNNHKLGNGTIFIIFIYLKFYCESKKIIFNPTDINLLSINDSLLNQYKWKNLFNFLYYSPIKNNKDLNNSNIKKRISFYSAYKYFNSLKLHEKEKLILNLQNDFKEKISELHDNRDYISICIHLRCPCDLELVKGILALPYQHFNSKLKIYDNCNSYYKLLYSDLIVSILKNIKDDSRVRLHIHSLCSESILRDFINLLPNTLEVCIYKDDAYTSFIDFLKCDYFIAGHSSFSYLAVLLRNSNTFIRSGFRHYIPKYVSIINEHNLKVNNFNYFQLKYFNFIKFLYVILYYCCSIFKYSKNFILKKADT